MYEHLISQLCFSWWSRKMSQMEWMIHARKLLSMMILHTVHIMYLSATGEEQNLDIFRGGTALRRHLLPFSQEFCPVPVLGSHPTVNLLFSSNCYQSRKKSSFNMKEWLSHYVFTTAGLGQSILFSSTLGWSDRGSKWYKLSIGWYRLGYRWVLKVQSILHMHSTL